FRLYYGPLQRVPGPWYTNLTTMVYIFHTLRGNGPRYVDELHKIYGPVLRLGPDKVDTTEIEGVKKIHRVKADYLKTSFYQGVPPGKEHMLNTQDRAFHRRHRKLLSAPLSENGLRSKVPQIEAQVRLAIKRMGDEMRTRGAIDVYQWWMFMTTDVIGELTFGDSFNMLESGKINTYIQDLQFAGKLVSIAAHFLVLTTFLTHTRLPFVSNSWNDRSERMRSYAESQIGKLKSRLENGQEDGEKYLMGRLLQGQTVDGEGLSDKEISDDAELYIVAGSDTTSNSLTYITWALCKNSKLRERLVQELSSLPSSFTDSDLKQLKFLNQCIHEGLRCYPVVPGGLSHYVPKEGTSFGGYWVPGGVTVTTQNWSLHRNPDIFPDPDRFDPSRWDRVTQDMKDSWMPFGGGSRNCIGMHLAYIELRLGIAHFFRAFPNAKVSTLEGMSDDDMKLALHFISSPQYHRCLIDAAAQSSCSSI
ncbi:cytochrome P450 CYP684A2, partial [Microdochium trichocladiopsis]